MGTQQSNNQETFQYYYEHLKAFLTNAKISNRKFAQIAGIAPTTFQSMLTRKNAMKSDVAAKIQIAMRKVIDEGQYEDRIKQKLELNLKTFSKILTSPSSFSSLVGSIGASLSGRTTENIFDEAEQLTRSLLDDDEERLYDALNGKMSSAQWELFVISVLDLNDEGIKKLIDHANDLIETGLYDRPEDRSHRTDNKPQIESGGS